VHSLFEEPGIVFENGQTVWRAVNDFKNVKAIKSGGKKVSAKASAPYYISPSVL